jgi:hypothetical protein
VIAERVIKSRGTNTRSSVGPSRRRKRRTGGRPPPRPRTWTTDEGWPLRARRGPSPVRARGRGGARAGDQSRSGRLPAQRRTCLLARRADFFACERGHPPKYPGASSGVIERTGTRNPFPRTSAMARSGTFLAAGHPGAARGPRVRRAPAPRARDRGSARG